ncbi:hypothetical protein Poli38472_003772 [Pythium oligandrum]|uniref:Golgin subfamily A member 7/ERF4 domain-containing protein n=1 Tax=Pythium oligandrum TaxID=41045 RepID=A0A8K1CM17_PYTOL|nr:hypothetical protein Poli38472_003772 [Pythium oligandrum]|eukprot:TMW66007.1 hypothetical protein Poli38472_003772 [Pythium oligandrum]
MVATSFHAASAENDRVIAPTTSVDGQKGAEHEYGVIKLYPTQVRFITGIARAYDDDFPPELRLLVKEPDFETAINQINNTLKDYWPCFFCICCGYTFCPCTLGVSLVCPNLCIKDAEQYVHALIGRINKRHCFQRVGVEWRLARSCGRSWIEISYPMTQKPITEFAYQTNSLHANTIPVSLYPPSYNGPNTRRTAESRLIVEV